MGGESLKKGGKVLLTGGGGYLGSVVSRKLLEAGYNITILDNFACGVPSLWGLNLSQISVVREDVRNEPVLRKLVKGADVIIPLAALVGAPACAANPVLSRELNYKQIKVICNEASLNQLVLIPTTNSGYGVGENGVMCTEESPLRPISQYGRDKVDAEKMLLDSGRGVSFRLATVFGQSPRLRRDLLVNDFVYQAKMFGTIVLFESHFKRNFVHVDDVARAFEFGIENYDQLSGSCFNLGHDGSNVSKLELCEIIKEYFTTLRVYKDEFSKDPDQRNYVVSNEKLRRAGFAAERDISSAIRELDMAYNCMPRDVTTNV